MPKQTPSSIGCGRVAAVIAPCAFFEGREISVSLEADRDVRGCRYDNTGRPVPEPTIAVTVTPGRDREMTRPVTVHLDAVAALTIALALKRAAEALAPGTPSIK